MTDRKENPAGAGELPRSYDEAVTYIEALPRFTKKHPLAHTREFLHRLGDPAAEKKIIHVAGTNGKGSVCAMLASILMAEGKRTGLFTSPHLVRINERIRLDNVPIDDDVFYQVFCRVREAAAAMQAEGSGHPTYFEFLYAMAMCAFADAGEEYLVLETGLGGRLDATNVNEHPVLTVITSISLDHTQYLGNTIEEIAAEKAGILKRGVPLIFDGSNAAAAEVIKKAAAALDVPYRELIEEDFLVLNGDRNETVFTRLHAGDEENRTWRVPLAGDYQAMNACLALAGAEMLFGGAWTPEESSFHKELWGKALSGLHWEGRMEEACPHLILDGAHNPAAVEAFTKTVRQQMTEDAPPVFVFSAVSDKQYEDMIAALCKGSPAQAYIVTEIGDDRRIPAAELEEIFRKYTTGPVYCIPDVREALQKAFELRNTGEVYCLGSLYLAGRIKKLLSES